MFEITVGQLFASGIADDGLVVVINADFAAAGVWGFVGNIVINAAGSQSFQRIGDIGIGGRHLRAVVFFFLFLKRRILPVSAIVGIVIVNQHIIGGIYIFYKAFAIPSAAIIVGL
mgnify:CR=1 FL=1